MKVLIRADASTEIGTGHVMRCYVLAEQLRDRNVEVTFICRELTGHLIAFLQDKKYKVLTLPNDPNADENVVRGMETSWENDAKETIAQMKQQIIQVDWLIIDHYGIDVKWERLVKPYVKNIMVIDDLANRIHDCQLLLDQNLYRNKDTRYNNLVPTETKRLLGLNYLLLREEFFPYKTFTRTINRVQRILISFGGSDATNETMKTIKAIQSLKLKNVMVDVVLGYANPHAQSIKAYCEKEPNIIVYEKINYIAKLMANADIAIGSGGSTTWERCFMRLPTITLETASNQAEILTYLAELEAVCHLGKHSEVTEMAIRAAVETYMNDKDERKKMVMVLEQMMDGYQESFVAEYLIKTLKVRGD